jgi:UDP-glucose:(heptosyl)LPS alpha-1,3-glucosyltransferase
MTVLDALAMLPATAHLVLVGRESNLRPYIRHARERAVLARVTFAGPQPDPKPYFGAADVFVLPSLYDPLPNAALEAMACALPVITSTKSGVTELVMGADAGFVCDARDAAALAAHMRTLEDGSTRERMGSNARNAVLPLSHAAMTLQLVLLYKELLEASVARRQAAKSRTARAKAQPGVVSEADRSAARDSGGKADAS